MIEVTMSTVNELYCIEAEAVHLITPNHTTFEGQLENACERWDWEKTGEEKAILIMERGEDAKFNILFTGDWVSFGGKDYKFDK